MYCAIEWAMQGGVGVPKLRDGCKECYRFVQNTLSVKEYVV